MRIGSKGSRVKELQRALLRKGYTLPRWGDDGQLGGETWTAVFNYSRDHGLEWDEAQFESETGSIPAQIVKHVLNDRPVRPTVDGSADGPEDSRFFDVTGEHPLLKGRQGARPPDMVHTIVLHQMAVKFTPRRRDKQLYGERNALHRRIYHVGCHVAALMNGDVLYVNRLAAYVYHANVANRFSVGIEVEGLYEGVEGDRSTVWGRKTPHRLTATTVDAARRALRFTLEEGRRLGMPLRWIQAHRCYSGSRRSDPGSALWREVALWGVDELGLEVDYEIAQNGGLTLPIEWDPRGQCDYRGRASRRRRDVA